MAVIMDTLQPGGLFPVAEAKDISVQLNDDEQITLQDLLISRPSFYVESEADAPVRVGIGSAAEGTSYPVNITFTPVSRLSGGCGVSVIITNIATNHVAYTYNKAGCVGEVSLNTSLPIGSYVYKITLSNANGGVSVDGNIVVGNVMMNVSDFTNRFNTTILTAEKSTTMSLTGGTVVSAHDVSKISILLQAFKNGVPVDVLSREDGVVTDELEIILYDSAVDVLKAGTVLSIDKAISTFNITPDAIAIDAYSDTYQLKLECKVSVAGGNKVEKSELVTLETQVMRPETVVLIYDTQDKDRTIHASNLDTLQIPVRMLTSMMSVRSTGAAVRGTIKTKVTVDSNGNEVGEIQKSFTSNVKVFHGETILVPFRLPSDFKLPLSDDINIPEPSISCELIIEPVGVYATNISKFTIDNVIYTQKRPLTSGIDPAELIAEFYFENMDSGINYSEDALKYTQQGVTSPETFRLLLNAPAEVVNTKIGDDYKKTLHLDANNYACLQVRDEINGTWSNWSPYTALNQGSISSLTFEVGYLANKDNNSVFTCSLNGRKSIQIGGRNINTDLVTPLTAEVTEGELHHVTVTYGPNTITLADNTTQYIPGTRIYLNGVLTKAHEEQPAGFIGDVFGTASARRYICLNGEYGSGGELKPVPTGKVADIAYVRIYKRQLTSAEILSNYLVTATATERADEARKRQDIVKVYFIAEHFGNAEATGETYKNKYNMLQASFSTLNSITAKYPASISEPASKNTYAPCTVVYSLHDDSSTADDKRTYYLWSRGFGLDNKQMLESMFELDESGVPKYETYGIPFCEMYLQGTSTLSYPVKNYQPKLSSKKLPPSISKEDKTWLADKKYTLKCDFMEPSHRNNTPTACLYEDKIVSRITEMSREAPSPAAQVQAIHNNIYYKKYRDAINGFPVEVYLIDLPNTDETLARFEKINTSLEETVDWYSNYIRTNSALFTNVGSYMFNVDKEGKQLGFEIDWDDITCTAAAVNNSEDTTAAAIGINMSRAIFTGLSTDNRFYINNKELKGGCCSDTEFTIAGKQFTKKAVNETDEDKEKYTVHFNASTGHFNWVDLDETGQEVQCLLAISTDILPCVSYEGATNTNAAAAAFRPFEESWKLAVESAYKTHGVLKIKEPTDTDALERRKFAYRGFVIDSNNQNIAYYVPSNINDDGTPIAYKSVTEQKAAGIKQEVNGAEMLEFSPYLTFDEFKTLIESSTYAEFTDGNIALFPTVDDQKVKQKFAKVLSYTEWTAAYGEGYDYLEATLEPRFAYTDEDGFNVSYTRNGVDYSETVANDIAQYLTYAPINEAINWVFKMYSDLFSGDAAKEAAAATQFRLDFSKYFSYEYCLMYYLQMMAFAQVDNAGKNAMYDTWGDGKLYPRPYDMDTQAGLNNRGVDTTPTTAEMSRDTSPLLNNLTYVSNWDSISANDRFSHYNTSESALWKSFAKVFKRELSEEFKLQRSPGGFYDTSVLLPYIDDMTVNKISKSTYNVDGESKFWVLPPQSNTRSFLYCTGGDRRDRYTNYITERLKFLDSLFAHGNLGTQDVLVSVTATDNSHFIFKSDHPQYVYIASDTAPIANILIRPEDTYTDGVSKKYGVKVSYNLIDTDEAQNRNTNFYVCKNLVEFSGWRTFANLESLDLSGLNNLIELDLSYCTTLNAAATISVGENLEVVDISNSSYAKSLDLSKCKNLRVVRAQNSKLSGITLPEGAPLVELNLKNTNISRLALDGLTSLTNENLDISGCQDLTELSISACPEIASTNNSPFEIPQTVSSIVINACSKFKALKMSEHSARITNFQVSGLTSLALANCSFDLSEINLLSCIGLASLDISGSKVANCHLRLPTTVCEDRSQLSINISNTNFDCVTTAETAIENQVSGVFDFTGLFGIPEDIYITTDDYPFISCQTGSMGSLKLHDCSTMTILKNLQYIGDLSGFVGDCTTLKIIDDSVILIPYNAPRYDDSVQNITLDYTFAYCFDLHYITKNFLRLPKTLDNKTTYVDFAPAIKSARGLFWGCKSLTFAKMAGIISGLITVSNLEQACRDCTIHSNTYDPDCEEYTETSDTPQISFQDFFPKNGESSYEHKYITDLSGMFYSVSLAKAEFSEYSNGFTIVGNLPGSIVSIASIFAGSALYAVDISLLMDCTNLVNAREAFSGTRCSRITNKTTGATFFPNNCPVTNVSGLFGSTPLELSSTDTFESLFGVLNYVTHADFMFSACAGVQMSLDGLFHCLPNIKYADAMFAESGINNLPFGMDGNGNYKIGVAKSLTSARAMFRGIYLTDGTTNEEIKIALPADWLSTVMPNVKFIGAASRISNYNSEIVVYNTIADESAIDGTSTYHGNKLTAPNRFERHLNGGMFSNLKLSAAHKKATLTVPLCIFSDTHIIDCSAVFLQTTISDTVNFSVQSPVTVELVHTTPTADTKRPIFPAELKDCSYCFAGATLLPAFLTDTGDIKTGLSGIFAFDENNKNETLVSMAGLFCGIIARAMPAKTILTAILGSSGISNEYTKLVSMEDLFYLAQFLGFKTDFVDKMDANTEADVTCNDIYESVKDCYDFTGVALKLPSLRIASRTFCGLGYNITGILGADLLESCRNTLVYATRMFDETGITMLDSGSYRYAKKSNSGTFVEPVWDGASWKLKSSCYLATWFENHKHSLPKVVIDHLVLDGTTKTLLNENNYSAKIITTRVGDANNGYAPNWIPASSKEIVLYVPKTNKTADDFTYLQWFESVSDTQSVTGAAWSKKNPSLEEVCTLLGWTYSDEVVTGILVKTEDKTDLEVLTFDSFASAALNIVCMDATEEYQTSITHTFVDIISNESTASYSQYVTNNYETKTVQYGIFGSCTSLKDISFCFANCKRLGGTIPADLLVNTKSLVNISGLFAFSLNLYADFNKNAYTDPRAPGHSTLKVYYNNESDYTVLALHGSCKSVYPTFIERYSLDTVSGDYDVSYELLVEDGYLLPENFISSNIGITSVAGLLTGVGLTTACGVAKFTYDDSSVGSIANIPALKISNEIFATLTKLSNASYVFALCPLLHETDFTAEIFSRNANTLTHLTEAFSGTSVRTVQPFLLSSTKYPKLVDITRMLADTNHWRGKIEGSNTFGTNYSVSGGFAYYSELLDESGQPVQNPAIDTQALRRTRLPSINKIKFPKLTFSGTTYSLRNYIRDTNSEWTNSAVGSASVGLVNADELTYNGYEATWQNTNWRPVQTLYRINSSYGETKVKAKLIDLGD